MESPYLGDEFTRGRAQRSLLNDSGSLSREQIDSCTNQDYEAYLWISLTFVTLSIPVGIVGNLMVFTSVYFNKSLRNANNALLVNLAAADLMTCSLSAPISWVVIFMTTTMGQTTWNIPTLLCSVQVHFHIMSYSVQLVTLALIGLERHAAITHPFEKKKKRKRVIIGIITGWILGFLFGIISVLYLSSTPVFILCACIGKDQDRIFYGSAHLYILTPLGISCFLIVVYYYFKIYLIVRKHVKERDISLGGGGGGHDGNDQPSRRLAYLVMLLRPPFCLNCRSNRVAPKDGLPTLETQQASHTEEEEQVPSTKSEDVTVLPHPPPPQAQTYDPALMGQAGGSQEAMLGQVSEKSSFVSHHNISSCLSSSSNMEKAEGVETSTADMNSNKMMHRSFTSDIFCSEHFNNRKSLQYDFINVTGTYDSGARVTLNSQNVGFVLTGNQLAIYDQIRNVTTPPTSSSSAVGFRECSKDYMSIKTPRKIVVEPYSTVSGHVCSSISLPNLSDIQPGFSQIFLNDHAITTTTVKENKDSQLDSEEFIEQQTTLYQNVVDQKNTLKVTPLPVVDGKYINLNTSDGTDVEKGENVATESQIEDVAALANVVGSVCVFNPKNRERGRRSVEAGTAKRAAYIIIVFSICWLPLFIVTLLNASSLTVTPLYMLVFFSCTVLFSSAINPIVYTVVNRSFRQEFKKIIRKPTKCLPC